VPALKQPEISPIANQLNRRSLLIATLVSLVWLLALAVLSFTTANPVTLNRAQILASTDVLTAVVEDVQQGIVRVERSWRNRVTEQSLSVTNLRTSAATVGLRLLIPVVRDNGDWQVTPSPFSERGAAVYPAMPDAERQLESLLTTGRLP
jgi:hypothetical protein